MQQAPECTTAKISKESEPQPSTFYNAVEIVTPEEPRTPPRGQNVQYRFTSAALTPRKKYLLKERKYYKNVCKRLKRSLNWKKRIFTIGKLFCKHDNKDILLNKDFKLLQNMSPAAEIFIKSQLKHSQDKKMHKWTKEENALSLAIFKSSPKCYIVKKKLFITVCSNSTSYVGKY